MGLIKSIKKIFFNDNNKEVITKSNNDSTNKEYSTRKVTNTYYGMKDEEEFKRLQGSERKIYFDYGVYDEFVVLDVETTGLDCIEDRIIELSALKYKNGNLVDKFETLINPECTIEPFITKINGITNEMVAGYPNIYDILPSFGEFIGDLPLVAHNARFDIEFLNCNLAVLGGYIDNKVIDTLKISRNIYKGLIDNFKLETIKNYLGMNELQSHRSTSDCIVAARIYLDYVEQKSSGPDFENELDKEVYNNVKKILIDNNRSLEYFKHIKNKSNVTLNYFYPFLKYKANGKLNYILSDIDRNVLLSKGLDFKDCSKSENYDNRILLTSPDIVFKIDDYILQEYDKCVDGLNHYKNNVKKAEKNIIDYLIK